MNNCIGSPASAMRRAFNRLPRLKRKSKFRSDSILRGEKDIRFVFALQRGDELRSSVTQTHTLDRDADRPDEISSIGNSGGLFRNHDIPARKPNLYLKIISRRHFVAADAIIHEEKSVVAKTAHGEARH